MKILVLLSLLGISLCYNGNKIPKQTTAPARPAHPAPADSSLLVHFKTDIQPILQNKCNPCHFPGGKMYEAMPFDQAGTILKHQDGMQKRIKDGAEGRLLRAFLDQAANKTNHPGF